MILNAVSPVLPSCWVFAFALGHGVSFFGGIQHYPVNGCSAVSCNFGVLAEDERTSLLRHLGLDFFSGKGDAKSKGSEEGTECCDTSIVEEWKVSVAGVK